MLNKKITIIITVIIIIAGFLINSILSNQKEMMKRKPKRESKKTVKIITVQNKDIQTQFEISGHLTALDKVELFAEVSGILLKTEKRFKEGARFLKDETLIMIDDAVYRNNVLAQKSSLMNQLTLLLPDLSIDFPESAGQWQDYLKEFDLEKFLLPLPKPDSDKERYYIASRNIFYQFYAIKSMEEILAKYTIQAPYDGVVTQANINPGTLVRVGQKLGEFTNTDVYELEAAASVHEVQHIKTGDRVSLFSNEIEGKFDGQIQRINAVIDRESQTVKVYITTRDKRLRDGMYCTAHIASSPITNAMCVPRNLIVGNGHLYAVQDSVLKLIEVEVVAHENDKLIIRGLENGSQILGEPVVGAFDGKKIVNKKLNH